MSDKKKDSGLFVVVCTDLHAAMGPFATAKDALAVARQLNGTGKCIFMPVPFAFSPNVQYDVDKPVEDGAHYGQYL